MSINIINAISTIFSKDTNKENLGIFTILNIILLIITAFVYISSTKTPSIESLILPIIIAIIIIAYNAGFIGKSAHNSIKSRRGIFTNPFKNVLNLFKIGAKYVAGITLVILIFVIPLALIGYIGVYGTINTSPIIGLIALVPFFFIVWNMFAIISTAELSFLNTLRLKSFFDFQKIYNKYKQNKQLIHDLIRKKIYISFFLSIIIGILAYLFANNFAQSEEDIELIKTFSEIINGFILAILMIELNGQAGRLLFFEENKQEMQRTTKRRIKKQ